MLELMTLVGGFLDVGAIPTTSTINTFPSGRVTSTKILEWQMSVFMMGVNRFDRFMKARRDDSVNVNANDSTYALAA